MDSEKNQNQVSRRSPRALGNRWRDSHIPTAPATTAMEKWKSKGRIPTFPQRFPTLKQSKPKGDQSRPDTLVFRLISGLENTRKSTNRIARQLRKTQFPKMKRPRRGS